MSAEDDARERLAVADRAAQSITSIYVSRTENPTEALKRITECLRGYARAVSPEDRTTISVLSLIVVCLDRILDRLRECEIKLVLR